MSFTSCLYPRRLLRSSDTELYVAIHNIARIEESDQLCSDKIR